MKKIHCWAEGEVELWCGFDKALAQLATYSSILAWEISWTEEPGRLQSMGSQKSDTTEHSHTRARAHTHTHTHTLAQLAGSSGVRRAHWPALLCPQMHAHRKGVIYSEMALPSWGRSERSWQLKAVRSLHPLQLAAAPGRTCPCSSLSTTITG